MNSDKNSSSHCKKANATCDKCQYDEAPLWDRIKLAIHLILCNNCRRYRQKNKKLTSLLQQADFDSLNQEEKSELHSKFIAQLNENQQRK